MGLMKSEFDFIVVGGGSAGCALAARLSEDPATRVALLEAGGVGKHPFVAIPAFVVAALGRQRLNWGFQMEPQTALDGRRVPFWRGRMVGGTGSLNGMVYHRGQPQDYEDWAHAGIKGWSYADVLPYFTRSECNENYPASAFHGTDGPINVRYAGRPSPMVEPFIKGVQKLGFPHCDDFSGPRPEGVGMRQATIRDGLRDSSARAMLRPALGRANLTLVTDAHVKRVIIENRRATGVEIAQGNNVLAMTCRREVILCAGAVQSPQLLMCSGIGPAAELASHGIATVHDLPEVGMNLQDHPMATVLNRTHSTDAYGLSWRGFPGMVRDVLEYAFLRRGPMSSNMLESVAFLRTRQGLDRPDFQFVFQPLLRPSPKFPVPVGHGYGVTSILLYPHSRGRISLASSDALAAPRIDPALMTDDRDMEAMVGAVRLARTFMATEPFLRYKSREMLPGADAADDDAIRAFLRANTATVCHPVGTCRMGADEKSVVDPELRVRGVQGLRVADASIFPSIPGGNTNAPTIMVAEKAADLLLGRPAPPPAILPDHIIADLQQKGGTGRAM